MYDHELEFNISAGGRVFNANVIYGEGNQGQTFNLPNEGRRRLVRAEVEPTAEVSGTIRIKKNAGELGGTAAGIAVGSESLVPALPTLDVDSNVQISAVLELETPADHAYTQKVKLYFE